jgi:hypothetical protein
MARYCKSSEQINALQKGSEMGHGGGRSVGGSKGVARVLQWCYQGITRVM